MEIQHEQQNNQGSFFIDLEGKRLAHMSYTLTRERVMIIEHTEVDEALRGQNIGYRLVKAAADHARLLGLRIIPLCPFAHAVFLKKQEELGDVLKLT